MPLLPRSACLPAIRRLAATLALAAGLCAAGLVASEPAGATAASPLSPSWCLGRGATVEAWARTSPAIPICGPGPYYGGPDGWVNIPGPYGADGTYYNATDGFQCVELAERFLAVVAGLAPVKANGSTVAMNYHAAYPDTTLVLNGSRGAVGDPPSAGDVISFASGPDFAFSGDGHVAVVASSEVDRAGNGTVEIAQENVSSGDYLRTLDLVRWRLVDPQEPADAEYQFRYAEWLVVPTGRPAVLTDAAAVRVPALTAPAVFADPAVGLVVELPRLKSLGVSRRAALVARVRNGPRRAAR